MLTCAVFSAGGNSVFREFFLKLKFPLAIYGVSDFLQRNAQYMTNHLRWRGCGCLNDGDPTVSHLPACCHALHQQGLTN